MKVKLGALTNLAFYYKQRSVWRATQTVDDLNIEVFYFTSSNSAS